MIKNSINYYENNNQKWNDSSISPSFVNFKSKKKKNLIQNTKTREKEGKNELGIRLIKITILSTLCMFIALKGAPKKFRSKLDQLNKNLIDKNRHIGESGKNKGFMFGVREGLKKFAGYSKAIFNLSPLKDVVFSKIVQKTKFTNDLAQKITDFFERVSFRTLRRSYGKTYEKLEDFFASCEELNSQLPKEKIQEINEKIAAIRKSFAEGFSEGARRKRLSNIKTEFDGYDPVTKKKVDISFVNKVWKETYQNFKTFMKEKAYKSFISEELAVGTKVKNTQEINKAKYVISNSLTTMCEDCFDLLIHIDAFIEPDDPARNIIKKIANHLRQYQDVIKNTNGDGHEILLDGSIAENLGDLDNVFKQSKKYKKTTLEQISTEIETIIKRLQNHKRGGVNQILHIYKGFLPEDKFIQLLKTGYKATDSLEKSVDLEADKMFDKVRDMKICSAPHDALTLLTPFAAVAYGMSKAETNDEKVSVGIEYGIPIIGAVAITLYCTIALISAGPSLLIGGLSGLALNQLGVAADEARKKLKTKLNKSP